ncbi:hypothetical protein [Streptomyces sp. NBC_00063]|uniref:hypothetical protein n=1 Tax=Streptomyces sp. NBC_00063 TaxID=2975638 RepID=UPI00224DE020|nr:hypothetical protein [Streptomyces sp. NBC_00063]MCX5443874.1 hypothetical protein [Streptomyces sp. NBC_00063]
MTDGEQSLADAQRRHWQNTYTVHPGMYSEQPSAPTVHGDDVYEHGGFAVHFPRDLVDALADGWTLHEVHPFKEGDLPLRLWRITQTLPR